jgi:hypothetical protein
MKGPGLAARMLSSMVEGTNGAITNPIQESLCGPMLRTVPSFPERFGENIATQSEPA